MALLRALVGVLLYACLIVPGLINDLSPLWDSNRRSIADRAARSVVVEV